jgi:PAS domain S-box-containing protein
VIHDSEERFRLAFDAAPIGMVITTRDGQFLQANAAFCHMVGRSAAEVTRLGVYGLTDPADIESTDEGQTFRSPQTPPNGHIGR